MPAAELGWVVLLLGLLAVAACFVLPREIGREHEPLVDVNIDLPPVDELLSKARERALQAQLRARRRLHRGQPGPTPEEA